jgi:RHS repeat-associated protein
MELPDTRRRIGALLATLILFATQHADAAIGRTPGTASVSPDGEAVYAIPLALPPGTNGMTPALSLEYRHRTQGGLLGIGWSIGGLSQIARCPRNIAQDGVASPVTSTSADRFCLDGQRLVVTNGVAYGAVGAEYRTEIESFTRIRSFAGAGVGPQYFTVEAADGRVFEYGATPDSRVDSSTSVAHPTVPARIWALNRIRDRSGNVIDLEYSEDLQIGGFRVSGIRYNSNPAAGIAASHRVAFIYENRTNSDVDVSYVAGSPIRQVFRLDRIDVLYNGAILRRYELNYEPALSVTGRSRLASVQECGAGATDCRAATKFSWQNGVPGVGDSSSFPATVPGPTYYPDHSLWNVADINGDGRSDYLWAGGTTMSTATIRYRLGLADGAFGPELNSGIPCPSGIGRPFDRNGDGRDDLLLVSAARVWTIVPGSATGLGAPYSTSISVPAQIVDYRGADLNGDGLDDIAWSELLANTGNSLVVRARYALPAGGFSATPVTLYEQAESGSYETPEGGQFIGRPGERIDFDGDGADDLLMNENYTLARISATAHATEYFDGDFYGGTVFDLNGDGCTDYVYLHYTGTLRVRNAGCGIESSGADMLGPIGGGSRLLQVHDWNSDGRDDLLVRGPTTWWVALSSGDTLAAFADTGIPHEGSTIAGAVDVDGDGLEDLVTHSSGQMRRRLHKGLRPDLMLTATDGFGVNAEFSYRPLTDSAIYVRGSGASYPVQDMQSAALVVSRLAVTDGGGLGSKTAIAFTYERLRQHLLGRGTLGFEKRTQTDTTPGRQLRTEETRRQDFPFTGLPVSIVVRRESGQPVVASTYQWSRLDLGSGAAARSFPYLSNSVSRQYEVGGQYDGIEIASAVRNVSAIDSISGLVTDETTTVTELAGGAHAGASASLRALHTNIMNDTANWCLGRTLDAQVTASHTLAGGAPITRSVSLTWDSAKCRPTRQRLEPGSSQWQVTYDLAYDAFGNLASRAVTGAGMSARTTTLDWGSRGQFPVAIANPLSQSTQLSWDLANGLPLAMTDPNSLTRNWSYDAFGELVLESKPDGTRTTWSHATCAVGCDSRARLRVTQHDRDSAGVARVITHADIDQYGRAYRLMMQQPGGGTSVMTADADADGRILREYLPFWEGGTPPGFWQFTYDLLGRLTGAALHSATGSVKRSQALRYDGFTVTQTDALGHATAGTRTAWGKLAEVVDAAGNSTRFEYDAFGSLLRVRDALNNQVATITYNPRGTKLSQTDLDMGTWTWTRNALGETTGLRDAKGQMFAFTLDALGRVTDRTAPEGTSTWTWGNSATSRNIGRLTSVAGPGYSEQFAYDAAGRPASRTIMTDASYRYDYAYNTLGLLDSMTYPSSGTSTRFSVGFEYDAGRLVRVRNLDQSQLSQIPDPTGAASTLWRLNAQDAAGRLIDESLGTATRVITGFDPLTGAMEYRQAGTGGGTNAQNLAYAWDNNGNLVRRDDLNQALVEEFRHDVLDRLDESRRNGAINLDLEYDAIGNIRWKSDVCQSTTPCYTYHASRKHAVTSAGGQTYGYDANGNMTSRGGAAIGWSSENLPISIAHGNGNNSRFWYGPAGNRWKQVASHSGTTETTTYAGELMEKVSRNGVTTWRHYVPAPTGIVALHLRYSTGAQPATRYLTTDHLGSTDKILDASGNVMVAESFAAFGRRRGPGWTGLPTGQQLSAIGTITRDGFTGHEHLDNLDLIHMNGRVYDPHIGRFISADPYVPAPYDGQSLNRYSYVWNNPLAFIDPSGFTPCMQTQQGRCAQVTVIGATWAQYMRFVGGAGYSQMESATQRNPCGQESSALACALQNGRLVSPATVVLTAGNKTDSTLQRSRSTDWLEGTVARAGNIMLSSSPVAMLFGAGPDFEWFDVPDTAGGRAGATLGTVGYLAGGFAGMLRKGSSELIGTAPSQIARSFQGYGKYPGIDRFKDITLKKGTVLYSGFPGQSAFYTTPSAMRRSNASASYLYDGLQLARSVNYPMRTRMAAYEVLEDTPAAFGLAVKNVDHGAGWLPQVVVPSYESSLSFLRVIPLGP